MRNPFDEKDLSEWDYQFKYVPRIEFVEIDVKGAQNNPARYDRKIDPSHVESLLETLHHSAAEDIPPLPALVVCRNIDPGLYQYNLGNGSGVHRALAYQKAGWTWCDAYVVTEPDPKRLRRLPVLLNSRHGLKTPTEDKYRAIYEEVRRDGNNRNLSVLCRDYGVRKVGYERFAKIEKTCEVLGRRNDTSKARFTNDQLLELAKIPNDNVIRHAANFILQHKPPLDIVKQLVREIEDCPMRHETGWMGVVTRYMDRMPRVTVADPRGRVKPEPDKHWETLSTERRRAERLGLAVLEVSADRKRELNNAVDFWLSHFKQIKGVLIKDERFRKSG